MRAYIQNLLGSYTPTGDSFGGADWTFIVSGALLCIVVFYTLKFIFSLFK